MQEIKSKIVELEEKLTGEFFEDLYLEQQINYWKRQLQHFELKLKTNPNYT